VLWTTLICAKILNHKVYIPIAFRYTTPEIAPISPSVTTMEQPKFGIWAAIMQDGKQVILTKSVVDQATATGKRYHIWDAKLSGFGLRVEATGKKCFVARYRTGSGGRTAPRRFMVLGHFGPMTVDDGRKKAKQILGAVANGQDPAADVAAKRNEMTVSELVELYIKEGCFVQRGLRIGQPLKPLVKQYMTSRLRHHIVPLIGNRLITEVRPPDVEVLWRQIEKGFTRVDRKGGLRTRIIVKGGAGAAVRAVRDLSVVYSFAVHRDYVTDNPVIKARVRKTDAPRTRFLTLEELGVLGKAFDELAKDGANSKAVTICKLWALTGCRRNEIAGLKWSEIDFANGVLRLEETKTGKSIRPLPWAARLLLNEVPHPEGAIYVFPAEDGDGFYLGTKKIWPKVKKLSGLHDVTPHTLRHTIGSLAISHGESMAITGAVLGHVNPRSTAIYAHVQLGPMRQAAERVARRVASALAGRGGLERQPVGMIAAND
jgi:integrase